MMGKGDRVSRVVFAAVMIGVGILGLVYGNSALLWEPIPRNVPGRAVIIYFATLAGFGSGIGLLFRHSVTLACRVLLPFLLLWLVLLKLPRLLLAPEVMVSWESFGELAATSAGAWCLFAVHAGSWEQRHLGLAVGVNGIRAARWLLIAALPMIGLSHFVYHELTASLVPKWMSFPLGWTYLTGAASLAAAAGMLFGFYPRLAANLEAVMLWLITLLVWVPRVASMPTSQENWTEFVISCAIATGAWLVAGTYRSVPWLASGRAARLLPPVSAGAAQAR
jgi:uncharacterized membrane protein